MSEIVASIKTTSASLNNMIVSAVIPAGPVISNCKSSNPITDTLSLIFSNVSWASDDSIPSSNETLNKSVVLSLENICSCICAGNRSEEHTFELQSRFDLVCRLLLEKKNAADGLDGVTVIEVDGTSTVINSKPVTISYAC